jgi:hypothetical protein
MTAPDDNPNEKSYEKSRWHRQIATTDDKLDDNPDDNIEYNTR